MLLILSITPGTKMAQRSLQKGELVVQVPKASYPATVPGRQMPLVYLFLWYLSDYPTSSAVLLSSKIPAGYPWSFLFE